MGGIIVDTTFKKDGLNNVHIWSIVWVSNSGKVEYSFLVPKFLQHCYFQAKYLLRFNLNFRLPREKPEVNICMYLISVFLHIFDYPIRYCIFVISLHLVLYFLSYRAPNSYQRLGTKLLLVIMFK